MNTSSTIVEKPLVAELFRKLKSDPVVEMGQTTAEKIKMSTKKPEFTSNNYKLFLSSRERIKGSHPAIGVNLRKSQLRHEFLPHQV